MFKSIANWSRSIIGLAMLFAATGCDEFSEPDNPEPPIHEEETEILANAIVGDWLSATNGKTWITYNFTSTGRLTVKQMIDGLMIDMPDVTNLYYVQNNTVTGSYHLNSNGAMIYFDWVVNEASNLEIKYTAYDNNTNLGNGVLNRILTNVSLKRGVTVTPKYDALSGTNKISGYRSLNERVATVNPETGEIKGVFYGFTFICFDTEKGTAAIKVAVNPDTDSLADIIVGTWIYDNPAEKEWQKTIFASNDYIYVEWAPVYSYDEIEHADGTYSIIDASTATFSVTTPYGLVINQEWQTKSVNEYEIKYHSYSDGTSNGEYNAQRLMATLSMKAGSSIIPDYSNLLNGTPVISFASHSPQLATVDGDGKITAVSPGRTYIDLATMLGTAVIEVMVEKP